MGPMLAPRARAARDLASIGILITALALPGIGLPLGLDTAAPVEEQRKPAERPAFPTSRRAAAEFAARFDAYLDDHFGFRNGLLRLHGQVATSWLKRRPSETVEVMVGRQGWLYYTGVDAIRSLEGRSLFPEAGRRVWERCIRERGRWLAQRGIRYLVVFAPEKGSIYPEYLPDWLHPSTHGTRFDQAMDVLSGVSEAKVLDLRRALLDAKRRSPHPVFLLTDTHWNALGVHAAYAEIVTALGQWFPGVRPAPLSSFMLKWENRKGGDLARLIGQEHRLSENAPTLIPRVPARARDVDAAFHRTAASVSAAHPPIVTERDGADIRSAVVFRDSFATALVPLLSEHFGRAVFLWTYDFDCEAIERERPSVVIQEFAERVLYSLSPENPPQISNAPPPVR
jgi:alginate O-acetyltransferase complex protein AlgJ